ncbi:flippase [Desulfoferula mesophila]|uniref:Polysaccharide biosynthesis protein n=1 Tax=Desulfoferula mesophila TaxID=3058419 RepID=A0AAU9EIU4_9BACT|nr:hypothetical protein FAK_09670 [Desulfoferula mesophilus]
MPGPRLVGEVWRSPKARRAAANSGWLLAATVVARLSGLAVAVVLARVLGPEEYGVWGMALAVVALLSGLAGGGIAQVVVKELVRRPEREPQILGSALLIRLALFLPALAAALVAPHLPGLNQAGLGLVVTLLALAWLPQSFSGVTGALFQSRLQDRLNFQAGFLATVGEALGKCLAALAGAGLWVVAAVHSLASLVRAVLALRLLPGGWRQTREWRVESEVTRHLWSETWPIIFWSSMVAVYTSIDQLMLGYLVGPSSTGQYLAAVRLARVWLMLPPLILPSLFPYLVKLREENQALYEQRFAQIYWFFTWSAILISILVSLPADGLITLIFGPQYAGSGTMLAILVWGNVFSFQGLARGQWLIAEGLQRYSIYYAAIGALTNVGANLFLIPLWGGVGAAWATLLSLVCSILLGPLLFTPTRPSSLMLLRSYLPYRRGLLG